MPRFFALPGRADPLIRHVSPLLWWPLAALLLVAQRAGADSTRPELEAVPQEIPRPTSITSDPADVPGYLAHRQALAYRRSLVRARPATSNQQAYDVRYYEMDLRPDVATHLLSGSVRVTATVVAGPLTRIELDFDDVHMRCDAATSGGAATTYSQGAGLLTVNLDHAYANGEIVTVTVEYHGSPAGGAFGTSFGFFDLGPATMMSSLSEPYAARTWWPCKDDAADKADSVDVSITTPSGYITASNGLLVRATDDGRSAHYHWRERHPIATYLVSIASYPYSVSSDWYVTANDSMEIQFYLLPETAVETAALNLRVKNMIATFASRYGPYPFVDEKYGHAQFLFGGGMEHQTCSSLGVFGEYVMAHELSHQWWGDAVTCRDFHHVWLNEGFATFSEAIWAESAHGGLAAFHARLDDDTTFVPGTVYVPDLSDPNRIFNAELSYRKGAWVLAMLRHLLGDDAFYEALRTYRRQHEYGTAVTEDFQTACEQVSGMNLSKFFSEWIYGERYPEYRLAAEWAAAPGGGFDVTARIQQAQTWQIFWMPLDVRVVTNAGSVDFVARDSMGIQTFTFHVPSEPVSVELDPDRWVLRRPVESGLAPTPMSLATPYPNPVLTASTIDFTIPRAGTVDVDLIEISGRRVTRLLRTELPAGRHQFVWNGSGEAGKTVRAGVYWVNLEFQGERLARPIVVLK